MKGEKQRLKAKYDAKVAREKGKAVEEVKREFTAREQRLRESGFKTQAKLNTLRNLVNDTDSNDENVEPDSGASNRQRSQLHFFGGEMIK